MTALAFLAALLLSTLFRSLREVAAHGGQNQLVQHLTIYGPM